MNRCCFDGSILKPSRNVVGKVLNTNPCPCLCAVHRQVTASEHLRRLQSHLPLGFLKDLKNVAGRWGRRGESNHTPSSRSRDDGRRPCFKFLDAENWQCRISSWGVCVRKIQIINEIIIFRSVAMNNWAYQPILTKKLMDWINEFF